MRDDASMDINNTETVDEILAAFWRYVDAICANDIDAVVDAFWVSAHALRYGPNENLYGFDQIAAFRSGQRGQSLKLDITRLVITSFGNDFGTANCEMMRSDTGRSARMSHTWVRLDAGWRIVAAHVSSIPLP